MNPLRVGVIGTGYISQGAHLPAIQEEVERGVATFQAFCDVNTQTVEEAAAKFGVKNTYTDHHEMLEREELDALYLIIPPTFHTDVELMAAERGIPLLIEKPQTLDMQQALQFEEAIRKSGALCTVGFMMRYYPAAEFIRNRLAELTVRHANLQFFYSGAPIRHWTNRMELCGGTFVENSVHAIDLLRYQLDDDYDSVSAFYFERPHDPDPKAINLPYVYNANYKMKSGAVVNVTTSRVLTNTDATRRETLIICDDVLFEYSHDKVIENGEVAWEATERINPFYVQTKQFLEAVRTGDATKVRNNYSNSLNSLAAVLGANESASKGGEVVCCDMQNKRDLRP
jgi:myo-inositol 2-dehydrogenase/D-chiro-inositol 1-dehydrogenase